MLWIKYYMITQTNRKHYILRIEKTSANCCCKQAWKTNILLQPLQQYYKQYLFLKIFIYNNIIVIIIIYNNIYNAKS